MTAEEKHRLLYYIGLEKIESKAFRSLGDVVTKDAFFSSLNRLFLDTPLVRAEAQKAAEQIIRVSEVAARYYHPLNTVDSNLILTDTQKKWLLEWVRSKPDSLIVLPVELVTEEAIKRFAKAEQVGIIEKTQTGYKRKGISKAQLAYFLQKIYQPNPNNSVQFPDAALSDLFGENRLGKAASQLLNNKETSGKPRGYGIIDNLFID